MHACTYTLVHACLMKILLHVCFDHRLQSQYLYIGCKYIILKPQHKLCTLPHRLNFCLATSLCELAPFTVVCIVSLRVQIQVLSFMNCWVKFNICNFKWVTFILTSTVCKFLLMFAYLQGMCACINVFLFAWMQYLKSSVLFMLPAVLVSML